MKLTSLVLPALIFVVLGCAHGDTAPAHEPTPCPDPDCRGADRNLDATLFVQTAAEYEAIALQTFSAAEALASEGLEDPAWQAVEDVSAGEKPPAVIVDVDETVLDNSAYQARLILDDATFDRESWKEWVEEAKAEPVPGALEFARWADRAGITLFYVTNRRAEEEAATRRNLLALGFPIREEIDTVLTRGEREGWSGDKSTRRAHVALDFRVLLLIGDDLGDFVGRDWGGVAGRHEIVMANRDKWGKTWLVLPNPTYGSWMRALIEEN
ncbi:MAG: HAD family acid phosphatase, partial [Thermoanaerobaculia bacterium]|nr:HAD family acid phosphatase [Thermoanaerobaculia bacterium]